MKFPKSARLLKSRDFKRVRNFGVQKRAPHIVVNYRFYGDGGPRLGLTVSKRYGKAHDRNRFKRLIREAFREMQDELSPGLEVNVRPAISHKDVPLVLLREELRKLLAEQRAEKSC